MNTIGCWACCLLLCTPVLAQSGTEPILVTDMLRVRQLGGVTASSDGRFVAYTVRSIIEDGRQDYRYQSQIWIANVSRGEAPRQLTFDDAGASSPTWHPDGDRLVFVRPVRGVAQLFEISVYGGEARQLTDFEYGTTPPTVVARRAAHPVFGIAYHRGYREADRNEAGMVR